MDEKMAEISLNLFFINIYHVNNFGCKNDEKIDVYVACVFTSVYKTTTYTTNYEKYRTL